MKIKEKIKAFLFMILWFTIGYLLCSSHEIPNASGYISIRKRWCSTPFYVSIIISLVVVCLL